jgi:hypothetical protein
VFINPSTSSQSLTITSSNTATIVTIVPGSTVKVNALVASPSAPSDWVLNSLGNTVGPASATSGRVAVYDGTTGKLLQNGTKLETDLVVGPASATDNAIARFDGTTGKLVQNSGVEIDDSGNIKMSYPSGALGRINYQAASGDKIFLLQTITSTNNYGIGVDSGNLVTFGSVSGVDAWNVKAIQYSSSGAVTLGPTSSDALNHRVNGSIGLSSTLAMNSSSFRFVGSDNGGMMVGYSAFSTYLLAGGYYNGTSYIAKNANAALTGFRAAPITSDSDVAFEWYKNTDGDYTFSAGATLGTQTILSSMTAAGAWTLGPSGSTATNCAVNGAASVTHGVVFPASQNAVANANTLDDYEEGTFTPNFLWGGAASGITYGNRVGTYTKIGNRVFFHMHVDYSARGSSTGLFTITGLPFTSVATASGGDSAVAMRFLNVSLANYVITGFVGQSSTTIFLNATPTNFSADSTIILTHTAFPGTSGGFMITGHYITA